MQLSATITFTITLDSKELRLIVAALHGGLKKEQQEPALALQKRIAESRVSILAHIAQEAQKYAENLE